MTEYDPYHPIARLTPRPCGTAQIGNDVVTLDEERLQYHTMHEQVFRVLGASDGTRSVDEIAALVFGQSEESHLHLTERALLDLMDAGLIVEDGEARARFFNRRVLGRSAAALLLGAVGLPLVKSITAPDAASALSRCGEGNNVDPCGPGIGGCKSCCCCRLSPGLIFCADRSACEPTYECI